jgi:hypothetical protein
VCPLIFNSRAGFPRIRTRLTAPVGERPGTAPGLFTSAGQGAAPAIAAVDGPLVPDELARGRRPVGQKLARNAQGVLTGNRQQALGEQGGIGTAADARGGEDRATDLGPMGRDNVYFSVQLS